MERRTLLKHLFIFTSGAILLPGCFREAAQASLKLNHIKFSLDDENLLGAICEVLIPTTDTPGAKQLGLHLFVLKMLDDCYDKKAQDDFLLGMKQFQEKVLDKFNKPFLACTKAEQEDILKEVNANQYKDLIPHFYKIVKQNTIKGYTNSEYVMTNLVIYELVPGRYNGYFKVTPSKI